MKHEFFDVHHISFDVWLTLIRSNPEFKKKRDQLVKDFFSLSQPVEVISTHFRQWDIRFTAIDEITGKNMDAEEMIAIILSSLDHDLKNLNPSFIGNFLIRQDELFIQYHPALIEPSLKEHLHNLADLGMSFSILSNTGFIKGKTLRFLLDHLGVGSCFNFQLYSDEICCSKPSAQAYDELYKNVSMLRQINRHNILHIGDNPHADAFGANSAGMQSAVINSNNRSLLQLVISSEKIPA